MVIDHIERLVYQLIDDFQMTDEQTEELFVRFADALPTYNLTQKGQEIVDLVEQKDFKAGGGTD
tara:strand:+ start:165 stop:356 length:192 start_codon:yes stop_codon:yes gene_type:complete